MDENQNSRSVITTITSRAVSSRVRAMSIERCCLGLEPDLRAAGLISGWSLLAAVGIARASCRGAPADYYVPNRALNPEKSQRSASRGALAYFHTVYHRLWKILSRP